MVAVRFSAGFHTSSREQRCWNRSVAPPGQIAPSPAYRKAFVREVAKITIARASLRRGGLDSLDRSFGEDCSCVRAGRDPGSMIPFRRFAIGIIEASRPALLGVHCPGSSFAGVSPRDNERRVALRRASVGDALPVPDEALLHRRSRTTLKSGEISDTNSRHWPISSARAMPWLRKWPCGALGTGSGASGHERSRCRSIEF